MIKIKNWNRVIVIMSVSLVSIACQKSTDKKFKTINDFNSKFIDSLIPDNSNNNSYSTYYIHITGYANDSIRIKPGIEEDEFYYFYFKDSINEELRMDYYGHQTKYLLFDPYKASDGELEITYKLL